LRMAKQSGEYRFRGSIDCLCFYKMNDAYHVRLKSTLTSKRFWNDDAFEGSRKSCKRLAEGSRLASEVYKMVDEEKRVYKLFCFLKRKAILLLKEGVCVEEVQELLIDYLVDMGIMAEMELKDTGTHKDDRTKQKVRHITRVKKEHTLLGLDGVFGEREIASEKGRESG
jgi:hypothetical protein